jgi:histidyl-tRNA synthetase
LIKSGRKKPPVKFKSLKGIRDILPPETALWQKIENTCRESFKKYGFQEIVLPVIESTDVFIRSIGNTTDIVEKEMYTFLDKGDRSISLRPEGTAPFVRAFVEHHLYNEPPPQKYFYVGPMFRYERPQAFRYRQFYQIGAEALGTEDPKLDAEIISMLAVILKSIGLGAFDFEITSIGCSKCRPEYQKVLKNSLKNKLNLFCEDCRRRYEFNPLRILDCKVDSCIEASKESPAILDFLCADCKQHFDVLKHHLGLLNIPYVINPNIVRGLDYYTRTAFEVKSKSLGSQSAVAAGGRYDSLVAEFGGPPAPGIGFAIGLERIIPLLKETNMPAEHPDLFLCSLGQEASEKSFILTEQLRAKGLSVEMSYDNQSLRSQMRKADRIGARNVIVLGEDELKKGKALIKNMQDKKENEAALEVEEILKAVRREK